METNTNLRNLSRTSFGISIPKPCHEDWNKFTPDEKGAFCKVCSKSVHDFTKKTTEEIKTVLIEEMDAGKKVCGRFNENQLTTATPTLKGEMQEELQESLYSLNFTRVKKFALALFLVFGGYLFNTVKVSAQKIGKVAYIPRPETVKGEVSPRYVEPPKDTAQAKVVTPTPEVIKCTRNIMRTGDVMVEPIEKGVLGGAVAAVAETTVESTLLGNLMVESLIKGQVAVVEEPQVDMGLVEIIEEPIVGELTAIEWEPTEVQEDITVMGAMVIMAEPEVIEPPLVPVPSENAQQEIDGEFAVVESTYVEVGEVTPTLKGEMQHDDSIVKSRGQDVLNLTCYPNPSKGLINVKYNVKENVSTSIMLYDMHGNLIKTLVSPQNMHVADYASKFNISELPDGIYFCTLQSGDKKSTQRIVLGR